MQRIFAIYDWQHLPVGSRATVKTDLRHQRTVRLKVNAPKPMALYLSQEDGEEMFLAHIVGLDEIEFHVQGDYTLLPLGGDVYFNTQDGSNPAVDPIEPASFTQIVERRVRNPELELMERKMAENMERRMAAMYAGIAAQIAEKERANVLNTGTPAAVVDSGKPVKTDDATASGEPVEPAAGGKANA